MFPQFTVGNRLGNMECLKWRSCSLCNYTNILHSNCKATTGWKSGVNSKHTRSGGVGSNRSSSVSSADIGSHSFTFEERFPLKNFAWLYSNKRPRICILGGGFGGLYTALRLESLMWPPGKKPQVLLIDQSERFVFKPLLYDFLSGDADAWEIAPYFTELLTNTSVQYLKDKVEAVCPLNTSAYSSSPPSSAVGIILLESGHHIEYDWLVLALGAGSKLDVVQGASEYALPFSTFDDALNLKQQLNSLERRYGMDRSPIHICVVGCGYCGVELAATLSERLGHRGKVYCINAQATICPDAPSANREAAFKVLASRNVKLLLGYVVKRVRKIKNADVPEITEIHSEHEIALDLEPTERGLSSQTLEADLVLWTVGASPQMLPCTSSSHKKSFPINFKGQVEIDENLQVKGYLNIFAVGDIAGLQDSAGRLLPMTAQVAIQQADFAAWNLWAAINHRPLLSFRFQNLGEMMTLGKRDAVCNVNLVDSFVLEGLAATAARKTAYVYRMPTDEQRTKVGLSWFAKLSFDSIASLHGVFSQSLRTVDVFNMNHGC